MPLNRKIAYIDLTTGDIETKPIPLEVRKKFLGGRGLDAYLLYNHTKKGCDPLGPDNTLMISGGILTATCASATARTHAMAKSPLTGLLGTSLKFDGRFILQTQTDGAIDMLVVDFMTPGRLRAYARFDREAVRAIAEQGPADATVYLGKGHLAMTVDQGADMERYQGIVALDGGTLSEAAHVYFAQSEQIPTTVRLAAGPVQLGASGKGVYLVGLDSHVAFLVVTDEGEIRFIHSSGASPYCVVDESRDEARVLQNSRWRVTGNLTACGEVLESWLLGTRFKTRKL